jgi:hypothetical protein
MTVARADSRPVVRRTVREERVDGILFLIDEEEKAIHTLDPLPAAIWEILREPVAPAAIVRLLVEAFPQERPDRVARDLRRLLRDLDAKGLLADA